MIQDRNNVAESFGLIYFI